MSLPTVYPQGVIHLKKALKNKSAKVAILGLGYVGSALAKETSKAGYLTYGLGIDKTRILAAKKLGLDRLIPTMDFAVISQAQIVCICVPTPVKANHKPDLKFVKRAFLDTAKYISPGTLVILESSVSVGTTRRVGLPILAKSKLDLDTQVYLAHAPERVDPGNNKYDLVNTPRIVAGLTPDATRLVTLFYKKFIKKVVEVSTVEAAEFTKLFENTFRMVNISFINELARYSSKIGLDIHEVIEAAKTKPYGFLAHYPSIGVGGHCIPVDPFYLLDHARKNGVKLKLVEEALKINEHQPKLMAKKIFEIAQSKANGRAHSPKILLLGITYKPNISDTRESASLKLWTALEKLNAQVSYFDPLVPTYKGTTSLALTKENLEDQDLIVIATKHDQVDYQEVTAYNPQVIASQKTDSDILSLYRL